MNAAVTTAVEPTPQCADPLVPRRRMDRHRVLEALERYALVLLLGGIFLTFCLLPSTRDTFPSHANLSNLMSGQVVVCLLAFAFIIPLVAGAFDLSVGANLGLCSVVTAAVMSRFDAPLVVAVLVALAVGALVGVFNAIAVAHMKLDSFIITLASATIIAGLLQWYAKGVTINLGLSQTLIDFGNKEVLGVPRTGVLLVAVAALVWFLLEHTPYGRYLHAIGSNRRAAELVGVRVERTIFWGFVLSGVLGGLAGVVATANLGGGNPTVGPDLLFPALAAVFLGSTCIRPGTFNVLGTVVGVFFVAVAVSGLALMGVDTWIAPVFNGVALVVAVLLSSYLSRRRRAER